VVSIANPAAGRLLGVAPSDLIGRPLAAAFPPESSARLREALATHRRNPDRSLHLTLRGERSAGQERCFDVVIGDGNGGAAVGGVLATLRDATSRLERQRQLAHRAFHDQLTGLPNRAALLDLLGRELDRSDRDGRSATLLLLDLDRFKTVNDSLGHAAGDHLVVAVANRLRSAVRPGDLVARLGGDEFACLLRGVADARLACAAAPRVIASLQEPVVLDGHAIVPDASLGIACLSRPSLTAPDVPRAADAAMYEAKRRGRGCLALFDGHFAERDRVRLSLESDLRRALLNDELRLEFQPHIDLATGEIRKAEALVRWAHPSAAFSGPASS
jgi:diguanylate cyclase (GGDEF)-like protein/PAS domain S-box-containing protein